MKDMENPSRADIAKYLNLTRTTVSQNINKLISLGIVSENSGMAQGRGRPGNPLMLTSGHHLALGASFEDQDWFFSVINLNGTIVEQRHCTIPDFSITTFLDTLIENCVDFRKKYGEHLLPAIGIGSPGVIDHTTGTIVKAVDLGWHDIPLRQIIQQRLNIPSYILNRYRTSGLAEIRYGLGKGIKDVIYIGVGKGLGTAIFLDGKMMLTTNLHTGGISHIIVNPHGKLCQCGRRGCLYTVGSSQVLLDLAAKEYGKNRLLGEIMEDANKGDAKTCALVRTVADPLCMVIGHLINIINPQRIIIGGPMGMLGTYYCQYISEQVLETYLTPEISILQTSLDIFGGSRGAATLVADHLFELMVQPN